MSDQTPPGGPQPTPEDARAPQQADVRFGAPAPKPKRNPMVIWLSVVAGVLAVALVVVIGLLVVGAGGSPSAGPSATPSASPTATPSPTETTAIETPAPPARPTECAALFPAGYIDSLTTGGVLALNPGWAQPTLDTEFIGSNDGVLQDLIATTPDRLNCILVKASGGGDVGILTNVLWVDAERQAAAIAQMGAAGFTCSEESGGTMCFTDVSADGGDYGERHFLREGTWVATRWSNTAISGWTQTIVATLFPA